MDTLPSIQAMVRGSSLRNDYIHEYGFAVLNEVAIAALLPYGPMLEVGAGTGYWSYELQRAGMDIVATDPYEGRYGFKRSWLKIEPLYAIPAIQQYPSRNLLTVWPDYDAPWTGEMLPHFKGDIIAYVGEGCGGCTGDEAMHRHLEEFFEEIQTVTIPQFWGIHDKLVVYKRKERVSI